jgi:hypothetical protein
MTCLKLASLFTRRGFIRRLAALTGAGLSSVWHGPALAQVPQGHPRSGLPLLASPPPADLSISLDFGSGNIATFAGASATDMGEFVGEFVRQKCYMATNANYPDWRVFFRVDADRRGNRIIPPEAGWRDEVVVEYGRTTHGTPTNIPRSTPYTATVTKAGSIVYSVTVPGHWWYARWRYKSSDRPVVRTPATLKARGWIPNFTSAGLFGSNAYTSAVAWPGPMGVPVDPRGGFDVGMAGGGDNEQIGLTTEYAAQYAIFGNANLLTSVRTEGEWCGNWATHYRDDTTGAPINVVSGAKRFISDGGTINDLPSDHVYPQGSEPGYVFLDAAHMYANANMPWLLTDDPYFLEELHAKLDWVMLDQPSTSFPGLMRIDQTRAYAWGLRDLFLAVKTTPTATPLWLRSKAYWQTALINNLTFSMRYVTGPSRLSTIFRTWTITAFDGPWQTAWLNSEVGQGVLMGFSEWSSVFNWAVDGHIQMTNGTSGWPRQWPAPYYWFPKKSGGAVDIQIYDLDGHTDVTNATSWADAWAFYASGGGGPTSPSASDLRGIPVDSYGGGPQSGWDTTTLYQKYPYQGIGTLTQSHLCALRAELAIAVTNGTPGAQDCYDWIHSKTIELFAQAGGVGQARFSVDPTAPNTSPLDNLVAGKVRSLGPYANASVSGGSSITDYSGTVADPTAKRILTNGGGHGPCMETDIRAFDLQTLTWSSLYPSTAYSAMTLANMDQSKGRFVADNKPYARHTYGMLAISGRKLYCMQAQGMPYHPVESPDAANISEAQWGGRIWWYDFNTGTHGYSANATVPWYNAGAAIADPISGKIVVTGTDPRGSGIAMAWLYDTTSDTIREIHNGGFAIGVYENKMFYDSVADRFISISNTGAGAPVVSELTLNRANPTASTFVKVTPTGQVPSAFLTAFGWDNTNRRAGGGIINGLFYLYDATTRVWSRQQMEKETGGNATMTPAGYGCEFDPTSGSYIFLAYWKGVYGASDVDGNTYAYRPT